MTQIGNIPEIKRVKAHLDNLKEQNLVREWELPYENLLTRLTAAIFFLTPEKGVDLTRIWKELEVHKMLRYQLNEDK